MAEVLLNEGFVAGVVFHCQQALEKLLKAIWIETHEQAVPPRTHDLIRLAQEVAVGLEEWHPFLSDLTEQYVATRYEPSSGFSHFEALDYLERTKELWDRLRPTLR